MSPAARPTAARPDEQESVDGRPAGRGASRAALLLGPLAERLPWLAGLVDGQAAVGPVAPGGRGRRADEVYSLLRWLDPGRYPVDVPGAAHAVAPRSNEVYGVLPWLDPAWEPKGEASIESEVRPDGAAVDRELLRLLPWLRAAVQGERRRGGATVGELERMLPWLVEAPTRTPEGGGDPTEREMAAALPWLAWGEASGARGSGRARRVRSARVPPRSDKFHADDTSKEELHADDTSKEELHLDDRSPDIFVGAEFHEGLDGQLWGAGGAHEALMSSIAADGPRIPLGLNAPAVYRSEAGGGDMYAPIDLLLADLDRRAEVDIEGITRTWSGVGATYLRQPTHADIVWPGSVPMPIEADEDRCTYDAADEENTLRPTDTRDTSVTRIRRSSVYWVLYDARWDGLYELFSRLGAPDEGRHPLQVVLTWLTLGYNEQTDPTGQYAADQGTPMDWSGDHVSGRPPPAIQWRNADGSTELVNISDTGFAPSGAAVSLALDGGVEQRYLMASLDPRSRYKLYYIYLIGKATAQLLLDLREVLAEARPGFDMFDHILAIEMGNELDKANAPGTISGEDHAHLWARAVREGVRGMRELFDDAGQSVDLWLPSMSSYFELESASGASTLPTFGELLSWQSALLAYLATESDGTTGGPEVSHGAVNLGWFINQDYHYYHYANGQAPGHIARLAAEIEALQEQLDDSAFAGATLSISENGASTATGGMLADTSGSTQEENVHSGKVASNAYPYLDELVEEWYALDPRSSDAGDVADAFDDAAHRLQARDVWRRIGVALARGSAVAWHTHRDSTTSDFRGTGLRIDADSEASTGLAGGAATQLSWWAFRRLSNLLVQGADRSGSVLNGAAPGATLTLPAATEPVWQDYQGIDADPGLDSASATDMAVVIEFRSGTVSDYVYLIFVDPVAATDLEVTVTVTNEHGAYVWQVPSVPDSVTVSETFGDPYYPVCEPNPEFNQIAAAWGPADTSFTVSPPGTAGPLVADAHPILLLSNAPLTIACT